jgi:PAS domain S-box-containing protein
MTVAVKPDSVSKTEKKKNKQNDLSLLAKAIISNAGVGIYIVQHGKFVYVSELYQKITGYEDTELIGTYSLNNIYPDDREMVREEAVKCLKGKSFEPYEYRFVKKNDEIMWILETITPIVYKGERASLGSFMDITKRRKMEETIRQSEEKYRTILDEMEDAYFEVDLAGNITFLNDAICRLLRYPKEELLGESFRVHVNKDDLHIVYNAFGRIYSTGKPERDLCYKAVRKDGTTGFAEMTGFPLRNQKGEMIGFRGIGREVTERMKMEENLRQSEEKYRTILTDMQEGYFEVDLAGNFTFCNDSMS